MGGGWGWWKEGKKNICIKILVELVFSRKISLLFQIKEKKVNRDRMTYSNLLVTWQSVKSRLGLTLKTSIILVLGNCNSTSLGVCLP